MRTQLMEAEVEFQIERREIMRADKLKGACGGWGCRGQYR